MRKSGKIIFLLMAIAALSFVVYQKANAANAPALKEGTFLTGQTLSTWPSWSTLGNAFGVALPTDPINQLAPAGTCASHTNIFCVKDSNCPIIAGATTSEKCVLHDPETGWSVADRRFSFACSRDSYAFRYIASTTSGAYTVRAHFEDTGISPANYNSFVSSFVNTGIFKINDTSGICNQDQEISTLQAGACGDGRLNAGEQCDPPGQINYGACDSVANTIKVDVCSRSCQWAPSTTPYVSCSALSRCGNGVKESGEVCDDGNLNGKYNHCNTACNGGSALGKCGDNTIQSVYEICDPGTPGVEKYALNKNNSCSWDCQNWGPYCGDNIVNGPEECDGSQTCQVDGNPGVKVCTSDCKMSPNTTSSAHWVCTATSSPIATVTPGTCGDNVVNTNEICDRGAANNGRVCVPTYGAPCSYCSANCQNTIDVQPSQYCGNGVIESSEKCEVSGGNIFSAAANASSTALTKNTASNGYQELACSAETTAPHAIKKGTKTCADCAAGVIRNCVKCGADPSGVSVEGSVMNVLDNPLVDWLNNTTPDPLFARNITGASLGLSVSNQFPKRPCLIDGSTTGMCPDWTAPTSPLAARATKTSASPDLVSYTLLNPYTSGNPTALISSDPLCSTGDTFSAKYQMYVNEDWTRPLNFSIVAEPQSWQYDMVLSPVVSAATRPKDLRVVVSWVGSGDFYSGVLNPFFAPPQLEGPSYNLTCLPGGQICNISLQYANGTTYYNAPASYKKSGVWYHGFNSTPGQTSEEAFTIDTAAMSGNTYAFYVRSPSYPIRTFKNTAKLKVDVYLPEADNNQYHFSAPLKTYYFFSAAPSDNQNARYWQVFNINKPSSNLSILDIMDINTIITGGPNDWNYITSFASLPACTLADYQSSVSYSSGNALTCYAPNTQTTVWSKKTTSNCVGGLALPAPETVTCPSAPVNAPLAATAPTAPQNLRVTADSANNGTINIAWDLPASDGGSAITNFKIYRKTSALRDLFVLVATIPAKQNLLSNTGLANGTTYLYAISAVNAVGESAFSNQVSATP